MRKLLGSILTVLVATLGCALVIAFVAYTSTLQSFNNEAFNWGWPTAIPIFVIALYIFVPCALAVTLFRHEVGRTRSERSD